MASARKVRVVIDPRKSVRSPVMLGAILRLPGGEAVEATITDLSRDGFRATIPVELAEGMLFRVDLPVGSAPQAQVAWVAGGETGCLFLHPLAADEVKLIADIWDGHARPHLA